MTEFTFSGLKISAQDLSGVDPTSDDDDRLYHHDGSNSISLTGGSTTSRRGFYIWDHSAKAWFPSFANADLLDGMESGEFVHRDGSLAMQGDLDVGNYGLINLSGASGGTGELHLNTNHVELHSHSTGSNIRLKDSNGLLLIEGVEGGNFRVPNGQLTEQGDRVATRLWTNNNADVPNADYADNAGALGGNAASAYLHVSGDQMEGHFDLGGYEVRDSAGSLTLAGNVEIPNGNLGLSQGNEITLGGGAKIAQGTGGSFSLRSSGSGAGDVSFYDDANFQYILRGHEGGNVEIPNGNLDANSVSTDDSVTVSTGEATDTLHYGANQDRANAGDESVAIGFGARANGDDGAGGAINRHTAIGYNAAQTNTGGRVTATGYYAAQNNTGNTVTASGYRAAQNNTGNNVTASGYRAALNNTGDRVTASGYFAAQDNTGNTVTATGYQAAQNNTGNRVTASGYEAAQNNTGKSVTATGAYAAQNNTGNRVTATGYLAARGDGLADPTTMGDDNIGIGENAIRNNQASGLIAIGQDAGINAQTDDQLIITDRNGNRRMTMDLTTGDLKVEGSVTGNANL